MEIKVISRSSQYIGATTPKTVQAVCVFESGGQRFSVTKHLHWDGKNYVGRGYGDTKLLRFPPNILNGKLKLGDERRAA